MGRERERERERVEFNKKNIWIVAVFKKMKDDKKVDVRWISSVNNQNLTKIWIKDANALTVAFHMFF